jgi:hypothetical protein
VKIVKLLIVQFYTPVIFSMSPSWKAAGSIPDEVIELFPFYLILPAALGPVVYSASNRNEYQKIFLGLSRLSRKNVILDIS